MTNYKRHGQSVTNDGTGGWVRYEAGLVDLPDEERWLGVLGLRSFRLLLCAAIIALSALIARNIIFRGAVPWADLGAFTLLGLILGLVSRKPGWYPQLSWVVLAILFLDVLDGLSPWRQPILPTHLLMPILVLYGALLCDIAITAVATLGILALCAITWWRFTPLSITDKMMLFNIVLATLISGLTALGVWLHHKRLMKELRRQAERLRLELETSRRLNGVILHDIANPLTVLVGKVEIAQLSGCADSSDLGIMSKMIGHIASIIKMVRSVNANQPEAAVKLEVTTDQIAADLLEVFSGRLDAKKQTFSLTKGSGLRVRTIYDMLLNSVLANLLSNAMKFSPPGSGIEMRAFREGDNLRIEICDQGAGFPPELLLGGVRRNASSLGTAGEKGFGLGLDIVSLYISKLGGALEIMNLPDGGGAASVVLPAGNG